MPGNYTCCVRSCEVTGRNTVPLFRLPVGDVARLEQFLEFIDRPELSARQPNQLKHFLICALHFEGKYVNRTQCRTQLSRAAIPTIYDVTESPLWPMTSTLTLRRRKKRRTSEEMELARLMKTNSRRRTKKRGLPLTKKILKRSAVPSVFSWEENPEDSDNWDSSGNQWVERDPSDVDDDDGQKFAMVVEMGSDDRDADHNSDEERTGSPEVLVYEYEYDGDSLKPVLRSLSSDESSPQREAKHSIKGDATETKSNVDFIEDRILTSEQRDIVIEKLNAIRSDEDVRTRLGLKLTSGIEDYITERGNITKLEQLLRVRHVGPKTLRNLCDKLLDTGGRSPKSRSRDSSPVRRSKASSQLTSPALSDEMCAAVKTLVTIVVDLASVSWALVDTKKKILLDWKTIPLDESLSLKDVVVKAALIEKDLPAADLCVFEDPGGSHSSRGSQMLKSHLSCALATSLHIKREEASSVTKVVFVKNRLVEKHFNASVGSETISLQPFIADIIDQKIAVGHSNVSISQELVVYFKSTHASSREQLSRAGLLAISCVDLVLNKNQPVPPRVIKEEVIYESS